MEWYLAPELITEEDWTAKVDALREHTQSAAGLQPWLDEFTRAVVTRAHETMQRGDAIGVLLSGGVDSCLIAMILHKNNIPFQCFTAGFHEGNTKLPEDVIYARRIAHECNWAYHEILLDGARAQALLRECTRYLGDVADPVSVSIAAVVAAGAKLAREHGVTCLYGGLGAEELFGGYARHVKALTRGEDALNEELWRGLRAMYTRDLLRDSRLASGLGISVPTPFLDERVIISAMRIPASEKIVSGVRKMALRRFAIEEGVPEYIAMRPKQAAQYGSRLHKALFRLAKKAGTTEDNIIASFRS
jgi:asparagine synthase (glutamine-hydrolysing)